MLQEYVLDIRHIKGKNNVIADCLSRAQICKKVCQIAFLEGGGCCE